MSDELDAASRFPRDGWFTGPGSARFVGGIIGLLLVLPTVPATVLERGLGDVPAVVICAVAGMAALVAAILLIRRRLRFLGAFAVSLAVGCVFAAVISAVMDW